MLKINRRKLKTVCTIAHIIHTFQKPKTINRTKTGPFIVLASNEDILKQEICNFMISKYVGVTFEMWPAYNYKTLPLNGISCSPNILSKLKSKILEYIFALSIFLDCGGELPWTWHNQRCLSDRLTFLVFHDIFLTLDVFPYSTSNQIAFCKSRMCKSFSLHEQQQHGLS